MILFYCTWKFICVIIFK